MLSARIIGIPGAGKTYRAMEIVGKCREAGYGLTNIGFSTFTRAARREASARAVQIFGGTLEELEQRGWFRTIHSTAMRLLGVGRGELVTHDRDWFKDVLGEELDAESLEDSDTWTDQFKGMSPVALALQLWDVSRNRLKTVQDICDDASRFSMKRIDLSQVEHVVQTYEDAKRRDGRSDFTDFLLRYAGCKATVERGIETIQPEGADSMLGVWFQDEAQDASPLLDAVYKRLTKNCQYFYLLGDPDQCQPAGTRVLTDHGYKSIELLDPEKDRVASFARQSSAVVGFSKGFKFKKASRAYLGEIFTVCAGGKKTRCTDNHLWPIKLIRPQGKFCVYLMRRGLRYRIGKTQLVIKNGSAIGPVLRARAEKAQAMWILKVFDNNNEAHAWEQIISVRYGIPMTCFEDHTAWKNGGIRDGEMIDLIFDNIDLAALSVAAARCCLAFGRRIECPFWLSEKDPERRGKRVAMTAAACNLFPEFMEVPVHADKGRFSWSAFVLERADGSEIVYSLEVEKHHHYIADGIITHNCIYSWAGADGSRFMAWPHVKEDFLGKSWRCSRNILELGRRLISRNASASHYANLKLDPAREGGVVTDQDYDTWLAKVRPDQRTLVMARTNRLVAMTQAHLTNEGIPWRSNRSGARYPKEATSKMANAMAALERGEAIDREGWARIVQAVPVELLQRGAKKKYQRLHEGGPKEEITSTHVYADPAYGGTEKLAMLICNGKWRELMSGEEQKALKCKEKWGNLADHPRVIVSTIHGTKGMEAEDVFLDTSIGSPVIREMQNEEGAERERRVWYVGATRARENLHLIRGNGSNFEEIYECV